MDKHISTKGTHVDIENELTARQANIGVSKYFFFHALGKAYYIWYLKIDGRNMENNLELRIIY